jgi:hypothetical protein
MSFHPLSEKWVLWAHLPHNTDWSISSYIPIMSVSNVEELITTMSALPESLLINCMLFLMKDGIQPMWEDPKNKKGGCFSYKIMNKQVPQIWKQLSYCIAGNTVTKDINMNKNIMGLSISPKKSFCIIKIWMGSCLFKDPTKITNVPLLKHDGCIFKQH